MMPPVHQLDEHLRAVPVDRLDNGSPRFDGPLAEQLPQRRILRCRVDDRAALDDESDASPGPLDVVVRTLSAGRENPGRDGSGTVYPGPWGVTYSRLRHLDRTDLQRRKEMRECLSLLHQSPLPRRPTAWSDDDLTLQSADRSRMVADKLVHPHFESAREPKRRSPRQEQRRLGEARELATGWAPRCSR